MKKKILAVSFLLFISWCGIAFSETCYSVDGTVVTINVSNEIQMGSIHLNLVDPNGNDAFDHEGDIVGIVTDRSSPGVTHLIHTATFEDRSKFVTYGDEAYVTDIKEFGENSSPCAYYVRENITNIVKQ